MAAMILAAHPNLPQASSLQDAGKQCRSLQSPGLSVAGGFKAGEEHGSDLRHQKVITQREARVWILHMQQVPCIASRDLSVRAMSCNVPSGLCYLADVLTLLKLHCWTSLTGAACLLQLCGIVVARTEPGLT